MVGHAHRSAVTEVDRTESLVVELFAELGNASVHSLSCAQEVE